MSSERSIQFLLSALCLSLSQWVLAATIHFNPASTSGLSIGDRFTLEILGSDFVDDRGTPADTTDDQPGTFGGGLDLSWNANVLTISDLADIELLLPGDRGGSFEKGTLDAGAGNLRNLSTANSAPIALANFTIAKITFTALNPGTSTISLDTGTFAAGGRNVWSTFEGFDEIPNLQFVNAAATVVVSAVPLPAPLLLLPSALSFIALRTRNRLVRGEPLRR
jgi:hypothetical protein